MRIAIVGTGSLIAEILPELSNLSCIQIQSITSTKRSFDKAIAFQKQYGIPNVFDDYEEMLASSKEDTDAVYLATPNDTHYEMAKSALENGYSVILEKPFTRTFSEAVELFSVAEEHSVFLWEAITNQYYPQLEILKEALKSLGTITYADFQFSQYSRKYDRYLAGEYFPVFDWKRAGGALMDLNIYNIHACASLFGKPEGFRYYPTVVRHPVTKDPVDVSGVLVEQFTDKTVTCVGCKNAQGPSRILIEGTLGYIEQISSPSLMNAPMALHLRKENTTRNLLEGLTIPYRIVNEFEAFNAMFVNKDRLAYSVHKEETLLVEEILSSAFASMTKQ